MRVLSRIFGGLLVVTALFVAGISSSFADYDQVGCEAKGWTWVEGECCVWYNPDNKICIHSDEVDGILKKLGCDVGAGYIDAEGETHCCPEKTKPNSTTYQCECEEGKAFNPSKGTCEDGCTDFYIDLDGGEKKCCPVEANVIPENGECECKEEGQVFNPGTAMCETGCDEGYYFQDGECHECDAGFYCPGDNTKRACPDNWRSDPGSKFDVDCYRTVNFNKNGGSGTINGTGGTTEASKVCNYNTPCTVTNPSGGVLTLSGYSFPGGWGTSSCTAATPTSPVITSTSSLYPTVYACKAPITFYIQYHNECPGTPSGSMSTQNVTYASGAVLPDNGFDCTGGSGYTFRGFAQDSPSGYLWGPGANISELETHQNATLHMYALWEANQSSGTYKITVTHGAGVSGVNTSLSGWTCSNGTCWKNLAQGATINFSNGWGVTYKNGYHGLAYTTTAGSMSGSTYTVGSSNATITVEATALYGPSPSITGASTKTYNESNNTLTVNVGTTYDSSVTVYYEFGQTNASSSTSCGSYTWSGTAGTTNNLTVTKNAFFGYKCYKVSVHAEGEGGLETSEVKSNAVTVGRIRRSITFNANGGTLDGSSTGYAQYGSSTLYNSATSASAATVSVPSAYQTGKQFDGWYTAATGGIQVYNASGVLQRNVSGYTNASSQWIPTGNKTLYAKWIQTTPTTVTVTLNKNGGNGTCASSKTCTPGLSCTLPSWNSETCNIYNGNKIFQGWATTNNATSGTTTITGPSSDTTYYAVWRTPTSCSVTNSSSTAWQNTEYNFPVCLAQCYLGYGSHYDNTYTGNVFFGDTAGSLTVTGTCGAIGAKTYYNKNGGSGTNHGGYDLWTYNSTGVVRPYNYSEYVFTAPTGGTFANWKCRAGRANDSGDTYHGTNGAECGTFNAGNAPVSAVNNALLATSSSSGALTFFACWQFNINFNETDGTSISTDTYNNCEEKTISNVPTKAGYTFSEWCTDIELTQCTENPVISAGSTGTKTYYAKWTSGNYLLTLTDTHVSSNSRSLFEIYGSGWKSNNGGTPGGNITTIPYPTRSGYTFRGYYTSNQSDVDSNVSSTTGFKMKTTLTEINGCTGTNCSTTITQDTEWFAAWAQNCSMTGNGTCTLTIGDNGQVTYSASCDNANGYTLSGNGTANPVCTPNTYTVSYTLNDGITLPSGYKRLEYLESKGQQYINTGFVPTEDYEHKIVFEVVNSTNSNKYICGSGTSGGRGGNLRVNANTLNGLYIGGGSAVNLINTQTLSSGKQVMLMNLHNNATNRVILNGNAIGNSNQDTIRSEGQLTLFATAGSSIPTDVRIYNSVITQNGVVKHNFVPARRESDGAIGMYDLADTNTNTAFHNNAGSGTFAYAEFTSSSTETYNTEFTVPAPTHPHGTFAGWDISGMDTTTHYHGTTSANTSFSTTTLNDTMSTKFKNLRATSGNVNFTANWTCDTGYSGANCAPAIYTINVNLNGGHQNGNSTTQYTFKEKYGVEWQSSSGNAIDTLPWAVRDNYTFAGYYDAATGGNLLWESNGSLPTDPTLFTADNTTVYAHWTPNTYTITVSAGNGVSTVSGTGWTNTGTASMSKTYDYGATIDLDTVITPTNKTGYYGNTYSSSGSGSLSNGSFTVGAGNATITVNAEGITAPTAENVTLASNITTGTFGYSTPTLTGTVENASTDYDSGISLYYKLGYVNVSSTTATCPSSGYDYTDTTAGTDNAITLAADEFLAYRCYKMQVYATDGVLTSTTTDSSNAVNLSLIQRRLKFNGNNGTVNNSTYKYGYARYGTGSLKAGYVSATDLNPYTAVREGYTFDGWWTATTGGSQVYDADLNLTSATISGYTSGGNLVLTANKNLYAHWILDTCDPGYYMSSGTCTACGAGYYCTGGTTRTACPAGLTTANDTEPKRHDEAGDCGRPFHLGTDDTLWLRSDKKVATTNANQNLASVALNFDFFASNGTPVNDGGQPDGVPDLFLNLSRYPSPMSSTKNFKMNINGTVYYGCDDGTCATE